MGLRWRGGRNEEMKDGRNYGVRKGGGRNEGMKEERGNEMKGLERRMERRNE